MRKTLSIMLVLLLGVVAYAEASDRTVVMKIEGMTCELCPLAIKKSLEGVQGVKSVKVSFDEKKAWVVADKSVMDEALTNAVRTAGPYRGTVIERKSTE